MTEGIPSNFDRPWPHSDVLLLTENAQGRPLNANKTVLSIFSPVMSAMFFHGFKEANQYSVEIHFDYEAMKEILRIIFQVEHPYSLNEQKEYDADILMEMYKAADFFDISIVRKICIDQVRLRPSVDMAFVAMEVDLHDILMEMLTGNLSRHEIEEFLSRESFHRRFSKKDVRCLFKAITGQDILNRVGVPTVVVNLEEVVPEIKNPRIDFTKKWFASDVAILTKNSAERLLYANKGTLASASEYFRELFFDEDMVSKELNKLRVDEKHIDCLYVDCDYSTVKTILFIIHNSDYMAEEFIEYSPALLYDMCRTAAKDHLDMPSIQNICGIKLLKNPQYWLGSMKNLEVAIKLNLEIQ